MTQPTGIKLIERVVWRIDADNPLGAFVSVNKPKSRQVPEVEPQGMRLARVVARFVERRAGERNRDGRLDRRAYRRVRTSTRLTRDEVQ